MIRGRIYLFETLELISVGPTSGAAAGQRVEIGSGRLQALLGYLALHRERAVDRDLAAASLWPRANPTAARRNLREYIYRARQVLADFMPEAELILVDTQALTFQPGRGCWIDVAEFEALLQQATQSDLEAEIRLRQQALALYRGDLLAGLYADWVVGERGRLQALFNNNLDRLSLALQANNDLDGAIAAARRRLEREPLHEPTQRRLMELFFISGDRSRALQQYEDYRGLLQAELGAVPLPETEALRSAIHNGSHRPASPVRTVGAPRPTLGATERHNPLPFVGRQVELARLSAAFEAARAGQARLVVIRGESGIGKTRLLTEWLQGVPNDTLLLHGRAYEFEHNMPYRPLLDALQPVLPGVPWEQLPPDPAFRWLLPLAQLLPDLYFHLPELAFAAGGAAAELPGREPVGPELPFEGLAQLLRAVLSQQPVIVFLDDVHWADLATWQYLAFAARRLAQQPLLLLATYTPSEAPRQPRLERVLGDAPNVDWVELNRLDEAAAAHLVEAALGHQPASNAELVQRLYALSGGHPLFLTESLRALTEHGPVTITVELLMQVPVNPAVRQFVENRLERLSLDSQCALAAAAAFGGSFSLELLAASLRTNADDLVSHVEAWLARGLVVECGPMVYDFGQPQIREVAYARLSRPRQRRLHYHIAQALEVLRPGEVERIADHYRRSDQPDLAAPLGLAAGRRETHR